MAEEGKTSLFREKSLEAVESPEALNDYLRVTSPGVWLVLATVIVLLVGGIVWAIFGRIETTEQLAVTCEDDQAICYVPYETLQQVVSRGSIRVGGRDYAFEVRDDAGVTVVSESMSPYVLVAGSLEVGDVVVEVPLADGLNDGVYTGTVVTESLQPISLLLQ